MSASLVGHAAAGTAPSRSGAVATLGILVAGVVGAFAFAWLNSRYAEWVVGALRLDGELARGLAFSAFGLVIGLGICLWRPALFGLTLGTAVARWRLILGVALALCAVAAVALIVLGGNPFRGANLVVQGIAVPVSEELVFRGVLFTLVLVGLKRIFPSETALPLAVVISAVAFGLGHLNNLGSYDTMFVVLQAAYATLLGMGAGFLRATTGSLYPAILVHAAVNVVAVLV